MKKNFSDTDANDGQQKPRGRKEEGKGKKDGRKEEEEERETSERREKESRKREKRLLVVCVRVWADGQVSGIR